MCVCSHGQSQVRQGLKTYSNWPTYPQVYVKGELIGGLDIIKVRQDMTSHATQPHSLLVSSPWCSLLSD